MRKTLDQIKEEVAKEHYLSAERNSSSTCRIEKYCDEVAERYAAESYRQAIEDNILIEEQVKDIFTLKK